MIKARATKFGILLSELYKAGNGKINCFLEKTGKAIYQEYSELQSNFYYSLSILKCIKKLEIDDEENSKLTRVGYPSLMTKNIEESLFSLFTVLKDMNNLYRKYLVFGDAIAERESCDLKKLNEEKLLLIGKIWAINDHLVSLSGNWKKLYTDLLTNYGVKLIEDILDEIKEFRENPEDFIGGNDDDPFGLNSDSEDEIEATLSLEQSQNIDRSLEIFETSFVNKLKLIKLLISTTKRFIADISVPQLEKEGNVTYLNLNRLVKSVKDIVKQLDGITIDIMEQQKCDLSELSVLLTSFKKQLKLVSNSNKNYDKFIDTWNIKYSA